MKDYPHHPRHKYFVKKEFQGRYMWHYFLLVLVGSIIFIGTFSFFSFNTFSIVYDNYHLQIGMTPKLLFKNLISLQWLIILLGGGGVAVFTLFLTHRIAGPFYRFEKVLDEMVDGDISQKIVLRKKDEGKELANKINAFNFILSDKLSIIENYNSKIALSASNLKKVLEEESGEQNEKTFALLYQILDSQRNVQTLINDYTFPREAL